MKPVRWETVKRRAMSAAGLHESVRFIVGHADAGAYALIAGIEDGSHDWRTKLLELSRLVHDRIRRWDVRCVKELHALFPDCLPSDCRYVVDMNEAGEWMITE